MTNTALLEDLKGELNKAMTSILLEAFPSSPKKSIEQAAKKVTAEALQFGAACTYNFSKATIDMLVDVSNHLLHDMKP